jgi:hypothetical protein
MLFPILGYVWWQTQIQHLPTRSFASRPANSLDCEKDMVTASTNGLVNVLLNGQYDSIVLLNITPNRCFALNSNSIQLLGLRFNGTWIFNSMVGFTGKTARRQGFYSEIAPGVPAHFPFDQLCEKCSLQTLPLPTTDPAYPLTCSYPCVELAFSNCPKQQILKYLETLTP